MTFPLRFRLSLAVPNVSYGELAQGDMKELLCSRSPSVKKIMYLALLALHIDYKFCSICNFQRTIYGKRIS